MVAKSAISLLVLLSSPALAAGSAGVSVPEGHGGVLFALGVLGVVIGRYAARRKSDDERK